MRLADSVVIVTGGGSGLGMVYARRLAEEGAAVVLADIRDGNPEIRKLTASNSRTLFVRADIRSPQEAQQLAATTVSKFGRVDVLVNNAALFSNLDRRPFEELTVEEWEEVPAVNVIGTFTCIRAVVPTMKSQKHGKIINVASNVVHKGLPHLLHYVASKGAVMAMTRALARELGAFGITVNATAPGGVIHDPHQVVRVAFFRGRNSTDPLVELVEPAGATSPVHSFLKRGGGLHHLCYEVKALDKHLEFMGLTFGKIVRPPLPAIAFGGRRIAWVFTKNKLLLEFLER